MPSWRDKLARPVRDSVDDVTLRTRADARAYMVKLPPRRASRAQWQAAARALLEEADAERVTSALELALLYEARLGFAQTQKRTPPDREARGRVHR
jgi:hypothetical protein